MTFIEFLTALTMDAKNHTWAVTAAGYLRDEVDRCPIESLAGMYGAWTNAGPALGLADDVVHQITHAADYSEYPGSRAALLQAVGLES